VYETSPGMCTVGSFNISDIEFSGSSARELVTSSLLWWNHWTLSV